MRRALQALDDGDPSGLALLEAGLLGCLMLAPHNRLHGCLTGLRPTDFADRHRGIAFAAIMLCKDPDLGFVVARLEEDGHPAPPGRTGWGDALARVLDLALVDDEAVPEAVKRIKEAALARRNAARMRRGDDD